MQRKISATYVYDDENDTFAEYLGLTYKRVEFDVRFDGAQYHVYACDQKSKRNFEVAKRSEEIFFDKNKKLYTVYLNTPDKDKAVALMADYLINQIEMDINYLERKLDKAMEKRTKYIEFHNKERPLF